MVSEIHATDRLWHLLWSQTARQIMAEFPECAGCELVSAGYGWGLRRRGDPQCALLLYPSGERRATGDLSLLLQGRGSQPIPRYGHSFPEYVAAVEDVVTTAIATYLRPAD